MTSETFDKPAPPLARLLANRPRILRAAALTVTLAQARLKAI